MALGATTRQAVITASAPGAALAAIGVAIGLLGARLMATVMRSLVWGVSVGDPLTFAMAGGAVLLVALVATLVPALRIVRLNPIRALRSA
jgi:ABC-type antimicrobial peptide transport system permease subunit